MQNLEDIVVRALAQFSAAADPSALENAKAGFLGKTGELTALLKTLGKLAPEERKAAGAGINVAKERLETALEARRAALAEAKMQARLGQEALDVTLPGRGRTPGGIHPVIRTWQRVEEIFRSIGFDVADGPEIETDWTNFTALNNPQNHPARSMQDTFYVDLKDASGLPLLLRTHTSPVQIRTMLREKPPIRIIAPGRVYRSDSDQTHTPMFHQIEGLVIDETTHMGHLKWCLEEFCKAFFEVDNVKMRFRASHFPFTEPSMEVDIDAAAIGKPGKWLEILGAGMVHPKVIANCGLDPEKYQGFAFGMGLDRITMLKYGIPDLRDMFTGDLRWMKHYGFLPLDVPALAGGLSS